MKKLILLICCVSLHAAQGGEERNTAERLKEEDEKRVNLQDVLCVIEQEIKSRGLPVVQAEIRAQAATKSAPASTPEDTTAGPELVTALPMAEVAQPAVPVLSPKPSCIPECGVIYWYVSGAGMGLMIAVWAIEKQYGWKKLCTGCISSIKALGLHHKNKRKKRTGHRRRHSN